ncbi:hypothetical protein [Seonamhaeicola maritimus]|uniref:hypothetical protein n=1 Tax=Seonamhaeicola maritimus TaxID=2591822 RepID=UPI0024949DCB|nr:hypothetical protein [Seonamhaeicola maritimus]
MSDKKHIDRLFQESFKDFEATPSDAVWKNIEANLKRKKKRRVIPIWWRYAGVAALLLLLLTVGGVFNGDIDNTNPIEVVGTENDNTSDSGIKTPDNFENTTNAVVSNSNEIKVIAEEKATSIKNSNRTIVLQKETSIAETSYSKNKNKSQFDKNLKNNYPPYSNNNVIAENEVKEVIPNNNRLPDNVVNNNSIALVNTNKDKTNPLQNKSSENNTVSFFKDRIKETPKQTIAKNKEEDRTIEEALAENKDLLLKDDIKVSRWTVAPNAAPVYFNTLGNGSSIDPQFANNSKTGEVNMSYGLSASYALNDKISIRSGINKVNLGYNTNDVIIFQTTGLNSSASSLQNVKGNSINNNSFENVSIVSGQNFNKSGIPESFASTNNSINQTFGFIEIPLEIKYALSDKKLGVNVIGGFSSFFLNNNQIFSEAENGTRSFLGEANNLNKVSYSANFGLGFNYKITKKFDLNLEPMFKYQINTFNNTSGSFKPYIIGVYTGFAIKF